jgi:hypothetical protein
MNIRLKLIVFLREIIKTHQDLKTFSVIIFVLLLNLIPFPTMGQAGKFILEDLINKTWSMQGLNDLKEDESYEVDIISIFLDNNFVGKQEYYLSDSVVTVFDSIKVGKIKEGKYIIKRFLRNEKFPEQPLKISAFEIIKLNPDTLILRNIKHQQTIMYFSK